MRVFFLTGKRLDCYLGKVQPFENSAFLNTEQSIYQILDIIGKPIIAISLLYSGKQNGWSQKIFHKHVDYKGPTLTLMKSSAGKKFGGFAMQPWGSPYFFN